MTKCASWKTANRYPRPGHPWKQSHDHLERTFTSDLHVRDDDRVISGTLVPYGVPVQIREYGKTYIEDFPRRVRRRR